jgi:DNA polymerase
MLGYAIDDEEPKLWIPNIPKDPGVQDALEFYGFIVDEDIPEDLRAALCNENVLIYAHNADFERAVNENQLFPTWMLPKVDSKRYRCTAAMCRYLALPGDLDGAGTALKLFEKKDKAGKALITKYCKPKKPTKNDPRIRRYLEDDIRDYIAFGDYCIQDVKTERAIHKKLDKISMTSWEWEVYRMTSDINFNGLPIDVETVKKAQALVLEYQEREIERCRELTAFIQREYDQENNTMREIGEERISPTQTQKLLWWVNNELCDPSLRLENLQAATIDGVLKSDKYPEHVKEPLRIRRSISRASVKKIFPMTGCAGRLDDRVRGTLLYHGATTGRWTARLIQPHNLPKPKIKNTRFALLL